MKRAIVIAADAARSRATSGASSCMGMLPPGTSEINSAVNAVQTLVAVQRADRWADRALSEHASGVARARRGCAGTDCRVARGARRY
jgi:hypothetical protein